MGAVNCNGVGAFTAEITRPLVGRWSATLTLDTESPPSGRVTIETPAGQLLGAVYRPGEYAGQSRVLVVAGSGRFGDELPAKDYSNATVKTILGDTLGALGETLSPTSGAAELGRRLTRWQRPAGSGLVIVEALMRQLEGASWRFLDDGSVWVGRELWPATKATLVKLYDDPGNGYVVLAPGDVDTLRPGEAFEGKQIRETVETYDGDAVRIVAHYGKGLADAFGAAVKRFAGDLDALAAYPATVVAQDASGLLEVKPDSPRVRELTKVPLWLGLPGAKAKVSRGARVMITFQNGDRTKPVATLWESAGGAVEITLTPKTKLGDAASLGIVRRSDLVATSFGPLPVQVNPSTGMGWTVPGLDPGISVPGGKHKANGAVVTASAKNKSE